MTLAQRIRQRSRSIVDGRYERYSRCEDCGRVVGDDYFSWSRSGETGKGVCLCEACCARWERER